MSAACWVQHGGERDQQQWAAMMLSKELLVQVLP